MPPPLFRTDSDKESLRTDILELSASQLDLTRAIELLHPWSTRCRWRILELYGVGDLSRMGTTMLELEQEIAAIPGGKKVSWSWLTTLSELLDDLFDISLVGASEEGSSIEVDLIDSSAWQFRGDERTLEQIAGRTEGVRE